MTMKIGMPRIRLVTMRSIFWVVVIALGDFFTQASQTSVMLS